MNGTESASSLLFPVAATSDTAGVELVKLRLPMPASPYKECYCGVTPDSEMDSLLLAGDSRQNPLAAGHEEAHAWGRWMLGHHLSFCAWRLLCDCLHRALSGHGRAGMDDVDGDFGYIAELFDTYSALLLYSGSFTSEVYEAVVRARMALAHPAFSGLWSRDYAMVHALTRQLESTAGLGKNLKTRIKFNRLVHMSLANRLVPKGHSLRRQSGYAHNVITEPERETLDTFFLTRRVDICRHEFVDQLHQRNALALADLASRPIAMKNGHESVNQFQEAIHFILERFAVIAREVTLGTCAPKVATAPDPQAMRSAARV